MLAMVSMSFCIDPTTLTKAGRVRGREWDPDSSHVEPVEMTRLF